AYILGKKGIPFIYLSANSNESTLEEAKKTQPYGFLVKPFREKELLLSIDIAIYRHKQNLELINRQEKWLSSILTSVINIGAGRNQKLSLLARAFTSFVPFDYLIIDANSADNGASSLYFFQRTAVDECTALEAEECLRKCRITREHLYLLRKTEAFYKEPYFHNEEAFITASQQNATAEKLRRIYGFQSKLWVPLSPRHDTKMSVLFYSLKPSSYTDYHLELMNSLRKLLAQALASTMDSSAEDRAVSVPALPATQLLKAKTPGIIGNSPRLLEALDKVTQVAPFDSTVLIMGETGVGKEGLVRAIHELSDRKTKALVKVNCAAIPHSLIESELFGHEKGAFTGAMDKRIGRFEQAHGGTLFLDEIGELPIEVQSTLLRAIQEKEIERVGGRTTIPTNVRIVTATNRNLLKEVAEGRFRLDLYYRLNVFPITLPPLRERKEDIPDLTRHFLLQIARRTGNDIIGVSTEAMQQLIDYPWPGNIRELEHTIERHFVLAKGRTISSFDLSEEFILPEIASENHTQKEMKTIAEMEAEHIIAALKKCNGKISGKGGAAELLKLPPTTLNSKIKRLGISWSYS
ncbi:MAG TPA: sigma-54-dependent Fis family transcriptional regulator, partial [Puia sp.]